MSSTSQKLQEMTAEASTVVIVQADNPDGDSLASALLLEHVLGDQSKNIWLYCGVDIPLHLQYLKGWDRVQKQLPENFDLSIIVDTSTITLLEQLEKNNQLIKLKTKPCVVIDHHDVESSIDFATLNINEKTVSTGEIIYSTAKELNWPLNQEAKELVAISILSDSLGLTSEGTLPSSIRIIADLLEQGVDLSELEATRRDTMRKSPELIAYRGQLLQRVEYYYDNRIAVIVIPWKEIEMYSHAYNPSMLVIDDMRLTEGTEVAIAFKVYQDGKITAKIRCNHGFGIANELANAFGGGGHFYASGFKIKEKTDISELKMEVISKANELLEAKRGS